MSRTLLIECSPRRASDGAVQTLRLVYNARQRGDFLGAQWHPVVLQPPVFDVSLGFDGEAFGARPTPQVGELAFALAGGAAGAAALVWKGAAVTVRQALWPAGAADAADGDFTTVWTGEAEELAANAGEARVRLLDAGKVLREPLIKLKWGSTGDALLDSADAKKDRAADDVVPMAWGQCFSVPGTLVDRLNNIWLFSGRPASSVAAFYDGGAAFTLGTARASLAALQGNVPARGAVDYCLDAAGKLLARPWDQPVYPFTADATFGATAAADIAAAMVAARTSLSFRAGAVAAFNTAQGAACGIYVADERTIGAALDQLFSGLGAWWKLRADGTIDLRQWGFATPALTVAAAKRGAPERLRLLPPTGRRAIGFARNNRVHQESEIAQILLSDRLSYADGTPIEDLRPGEAGATLGDNLQLNSRLETDLTGYNPAGFSMARVQGINGPPQPWVLQTTAGSSGGGEFQFPESPVAGGQPVSTSIWVMRTAALTTFQLAANQFNALTGAGIGPVGGTISIVPSAPNVWQKFTVPTASLLTEAGSMKLTLQNMTGNAGTVQVASGRIGYTVAGADPTAQQPIVSQLDPASGLALPGFQPATGGVFDRLAATGLARNGDAVSFPSALPYPPRIQLFYGGAAATAGQNIAVRAEAISASGFTLRAVSQSVTLGALINDTGATAGGGGEPDFIINRSNGSAVWNNNFDFGFTLDPGPSPPPFASGATVAFYVRQGGAWVEAARSVGLIAEEAQFYSKSISAGAVDFGGGSEFGVSLISAGSPPVSLAFNRVIYRLATVTETDLTPSASAEPIAWAAYT